MIPEQPDTNQRRDDSNFPSNRVLREAGKRALLNAFGVQVARRVARTETDFGPPNRTTHWGNHMERSTNPASGGTRWLVTICSGFLYSFLGMVFGTLLGSWIGLSI